MDKIGYTELSGILADVVKAIKTFVQYLKDFIAGFKTDYEFPDADEETAAVE